MPRSITRDLTVFTRAGSVTYALPSPAFSSPVVTITLPPKSTWTSGLHWHETHTEYLQIVRGIALVTLNNSTKTVTQEDGVITVPRFARHEWQRATADGPELIVKEWTDPADGQKEVFFRNLGSVILDCTKDEPPNECWLTWQLFVVFWGLDNYPVFVTFSWMPFIGRMLEWAITHVFLFVAVFAGKLVGLKSAYGEYTPGRLLANPMVEKAMRSGKDE